MPTVMTGTRAKDDSCPARNEHGVCRLTMHKVNYAQQHLETGENHMKTVLVFLVLMSLASAVSTVSSQNVKEMNDECQLIKVYLKEKSQFRQLVATGIDIIECKPSYLKAFVSKEQISWLNEIGLRIERLSVSEVIDESVFGLADAGLYHTYEEVETELHQIESIHSNIARVYDVGDSIEGREIWAIKISDNPTVEEASEPDVLYMGAHHAREWISVEIPMNLANCLVDNYGSDPRITALIDESEIWIVPMVNPDGVDYSQKVFQMWRKNKRDNNENGVFERAYDGVDNNRNYGYMWGYDNIGSSPYMGSETYRGAFAFSEPETQAIRDLALQQEFVLAVSYHSYGKLMLFPWGYVDEDTPDHKIYTDIASGMAEYNDYVYGNAKDGIIYNTNGGAIDWLYGERGTIAYTFELGSMFIPPEDQIEEIWLRNKGASLYLLQISDDPHQIYPSIDINLDKISYSEGDTMEVGLSLVNQRDAIDVGIYTWIDLPNGGKHWIAQNPWITLPKDFTFNNSAWKSYILPQLPSGDYVWHAIVVDPLTHYILNESIAPWTFTRTRETSCELQLRTTKVAALQ